MAKYKRFKVRASIGNRNVSADYNPKEADAQAQFRRVENELQRFTDHVKSNMQFVLVESLGIIFERSQELVPVDTSELKNSGYVTSARSRDISLAEIGYARGGFPDYALVVHEDLTKYHEAPTGAKYLELAINENFDDMAEFIKQATKDMAGF